MEIKQYIQENEARMLDELFSLIRIPSISALPPTLVRTVIGRWCTESRADAFGWQSVGVRRIHG